MNLIAENAILQGVLLGAAAMLIAPLLLQIPHMVWATLQNVYLDIAYYGLISTLKRRTNFKPSKQTVAYFVDLLWDIMRSIPVPALKAALDHESGKIIASFGTPIGQERVSMSDDGIVLKENKTFLSYLERIAKANETHTSTGTFYLNREQYEISKEIRMMSAAHGGHLANELHMTEYSAAIDMQKANT